MAHPCHCFRAHISSRLWCIISYYFHNVSPQGCKISCRGFWEREWISLVHTTLNEDVTLSRAKSQSTSRVRQLNTWHGIWHGMPCLHSLSSQYAMVYYVWIVCVFIYYVCRAMRVVTRLLCQVCVLTGAIAMPSASPQRHNTWNLVT